jgi:hypothetical protein
MHIFILKVQDIALIYTNRERFRERERERVAMPIAPRIANKICQRVSHQK